MKLHSLPKAQARNSISADVMRVTASPTFAQSGRHCILASLLWYLGEPHSSLTRQRHSVLMQKMRQCPKLV